MRGPAAAASVDDRHERLAGQVAAEDQDVGFVERGCVQELAPALLGAVDVAGVVDAHLLDRNLLEAAADVDSARPLDRLGGEVDDEAAAEDREVEDLRRELAVDPGARVGPERPGLDPE